MTILTKLTKEDFENVLENYNIGKYKSSKHIFTGTNTIYSLRTTKGKFLLKIYENASLKFVKDQVLLMEFLKKTKVSTPKIIDTKNKKGLIIYNKERISIQEFSKGAIPKRFNKKLILDIGKKFGYLDKILLKYHKKLNDDWEKDHEFKRLNLEIQSLLGPDFKRESKNLSNEMKKINKKYLRKSIIHGDLNASNILVKNNKVISIIDWDDVHEDYLVYEVCVLIAHNLITKKSIRKALIINFLKGYEKYIRLNEEEKKALYYFIKCRFLAIACWWINNLEKHKDKKKEILKWARKRILAYKRFNKIPLEEFLGWLR